MAASRRRAGRILSDNGTSSKGPSTVRPVRLELPPPPYDFHCSTFRYRTFGDDVASVWHDGGLHRVLRSGLVVRISADGIEASAEPTAEDHAEVFHTLGASFDLTSFEAAYPENYARAPGFRPPLSADPFESLVIAVTAQQISLVAACAIRNRFVRRFGRRCELGGVDVWAFPRREDVAGADLEGVGLSRAKIRSIAALAEADLDLPRAHRPRAPRPAHGAPRDRWLDRRLVPGPHPGAPDAFAAGDLGVRKAVARWFSDDPIWPEPRVREACLGFGEYANLAVHYLLVPDGAAGVAYGVNVCAVYVIMTSGREQHREGVLTSVSTRSDSPSSARAQKRGNATIPNRPIETRRPPEVGSRIRSGREDQVFGRHPHPPRLVEEPAPEEVKRGGRGTADGRPR